MKNYSDRNRDVDDLSRKLTYFYSHDIAKLHYKGLSDKDIVEWRVLDVKYKVPFDVAEKAVESARHTKRFMGYLLAEKMNDRRRNALRNKSGKGSLENS